ncbi:MAG: GNAT family N-acetyltransferase [Lutibacter sp.]
MNYYKALNKQEFSNGNFSIVPIRYEDRFAIMKWRNEQLYHLRQKQPLTVEDQENYFTNVVSQIFDEEQPKQILFSFLENGLCIGYGGLVHINWTDKNAEISFIMNTKLEKENFQKHWCNFLKLIEQVAFEELKFHKIFTYAFDLRPHLYQAIEIAGFSKEAVLKEHCLFNNVFLDVVIHSKFSNQNKLFIRDKLVLREAEINDAELLFNWANEINVRANSINQEPIIWENHLKWFLKKLNDSETKFLILTSENNFLGQIRIDLIDSYWNIDYSIDNQFRGKGLGTEIVRLILNKFESYKFKATVKKQNKASIKVFKNLGFRKMQVESDNFDYFEY